MTDTEARGHLPRRSFLVSAIAVVAASTLAGGAVVAAAPSASAATGADVTWRITSEPAEARTGYANLLNNIRRAIADHRIRSRDGSDPVGYPVDVTATTGPTYITVDLHAKTDIEFIRLIMRRSDSYVVGWFQGGEDGNGTVTLGDFFPLEPGLVNGQGGIPLGRPPGTNPDGTPDPGSRTQTRYNTLATYSNLAQQGATRDGMQITPTSLHNAVRVLQAGDHTISGYVRIAASAILQMIVGVAEASRFRNQVSCTEFRRARGLPRVGWRRDAWFQATGGVWMMVPPGRGERLPMAMARALVVSAAVGEASIDQPTTRRENVSRTTAQYTLPSKVGCSVMSVTHSWSRA